MSLEFNNNRVVVYADGACFDNHTRVGTRKAGYGVWFARNHPWNLWGAVKDCEATNNNAEIEAVIKALVKCSNKGYNNVEVRTDSEFVINSVRDWFQKWRANGWRKSDGRPVQNRQKFMELDDVMSGMNLKWVHVSAHQGIEGNEGANDLARKGAQSY